jgi:hypothetical protein
MSCGETIDFYLCDLLNRYIETINIHEKINKSLNTRKKIRNENFPPHISENLVKLILNTTKYKDSTTKVSWNTNVGDLEYNDLHFEVKAFISEGPCSFGPNERWDAIYFLDARSIKNRKIKLYEILLLNTDPLWCNIKMNKIETYQQQCQQKRRPRITFNSLIQQLPHHTVSLIYDGLVDDLFTTN